ncbi:protein phosphatase 1 regulatory subunit 27 [Athene cunicularia]|uniref:protein phosphatase 1 regulatory subunit 27 n=1 Tax=Athene cunicularia TaxID=194338 RepID=UPI000EF688D1|nr:protein phosphatase 1 regulatory subunit 27 [Athene cunicularia]
MKDYYPASMRRYSRYARRLRASRTVHFPNDVVFQDHIRQGDLEQVGRFIRARKVTLDTIYPSGECWRRRGSAGLRRTGASRVAHAGMWAPFGRGRAVTESFSSRERSSAPNVAKQDLRESHAIAPTSPLDSTVNVCCGKGGAGPLGPSKA